MEASVLFLKEGRLVLVMSACNFQWEQSREAAKEQVGGMGREVTQAGAGLLHLWYPLPPLPPATTPFSHLRSKWGFRRKGMTWKALCSDT